MAEHKSNPVLVAELLGREDLFTLTGTDGCLCAHITLRYIDIDVHCPKSPHQFTNYHGEKFECNCPYGGIHLTPDDPENEADMIRLGEVIRTQVQQIEGYEYTIVIHEPRNDWNYEGWVEPAKGERPKEIIVPAQAVD